MTLIAIIVFAVLAASPFTEPFSAIRFGDVLRSPALEQSQSTAPSDGFMASEARDTGATDFPRNLNVDVRPVARSSGHAHL